MLVKMSEKNHQASFVKDIKMKTAIALLFVGLFQLSLTMPMEDPPCEAAFSAAVCDGWKEIDDAVERERRQLPPPPGPGPDGGVYPPGPDGGGDPGKELIKKLLTEKLKFLTRFGLLKHIPFLGQFIHDLVERDPQGVSNALSGGIFAILGMVMGNLAKMPSPPFAPPRSRART